MERCGPAAASGAKWQRRIGRFVAAAGAAIIALCGTPIGAIAQHPWRLIDNETIVAKKTCIRTDDVVETDAGVSAWVRDTYVAAQRLSDGREFRSARAQLLVRCDADRWRVTHVVAYDASGAVVLDDAGPDDAWHDLRTRDAGSELARGACSVAAVKRQWAAAATLH